MALKKALALVLLVLAGGVALYGYETSLKYAGVATFGVAALSVLVALTSTKTSRSPEPVEEVSPVTESTPQPTTTVQESFDAEIVPGYGITDPVTGLMNHLFFAGVIGTKVATARRRLWPVSIALLHVTFTQQEHTREQENVALASFAKVIEATLRDADVACRVATRTFALVLDDTDEDGAAWAAERIQLTQARKADDVIAKVSAGIASYPSHGIEAAEILSRARDALERATSNADLPGLGLVIVAPQRPI
ncbi:MAG: GGDEF domain-containing protein [Acidimicrobiales bacterium]